MAKILIVGFGSIGSRHARVAAEDGHSVAVVSRRGGDLPYPSFPTIERAFAAEAFTHVIIASESAAHAAHLAEVEAAGFEGRVLVEKPLFSELSHGDQARVRPSVYVAYNLRFHPAVEHLREAVAGGRVLNIAVHAGQDLHQWRAGRSVESTYSTQKAAGGGVLRDLSHELDYLLWLFGPWREVTAIGGRLGELPGDSDDVWSIIIAMRSGAVCTLTLDYHCRIPVRTITVNTTASTIAADLVAGRTVDGEGVRQWPADRDLTYRAQLEAFVGEGATDSLCRYDEGVEVLRLIEAIESANEQRRWVSN